jgi:2-methylcitrate dehydratase PrpD
MTFTVTRTIQALTGTGTVTVPWETCTDAETALQALSECMSDAARQSDDVDAIKLRTLSIQVTVNN